MSITNNIFCVLKANLQKPKKKKEEANGTTEAKLNGIETKPKKDKTKKHEDVAKEDSSAIQSEEIKTTFTLSFFSLHLHCSLTKAVTYLFPYQHYRWEESEEKEARKRQRGTRKGKTD